MVASKRAEMRSVQIGFIIVVCMYVCMFAFLLFQAKFPGALNKSSLHEVDSDKTLKNKNQKPNHP